MALGTQAQAQDVCAARALQLFARAYARATVAVQAAARRRSACRLAGRMRTTATVIQAGARQWLARRTAGRRAAAAIVVGAGGRGGVVRRQARLARWTRAAVRLQAVARGRLARQQAAHARAADAADAAAPMEEGAAGDTVVVTGRKRPAADSGADDAPSPERPAAGAAALGPLFPSLQVPLPLLFVGWPREVSLLGRSR